MTNFFLQIKEQDISASREIKSELNVRSIIDFLNGLKGLNRPIKRVLDLGCGDGASVYQFRKNGYKAYGLDMTQVWGPYKKKMAHESLLDKDEEPFALMGSTRDNFPYNDQSFDFVLSQQVLEHIQNYRHTFEQIHRILKPGGVSVHIFPSKYRPIECHVYVPLGGVLQGRKYVGFWSMFGLYKKNYCFRHYRRFEAAQPIFKFLRDETNYLSGSEILQIADHYFEHACFLESAFLRHYLRNKFPSAPKLITEIAGTSYAGMIVRTFHSKVLFMQKSSKTCF